MAEPDPVIIRELLAQLKDTSKERRRTAVMKLGMLGGDQAVRALIYALQDDYEDLIVRGRAALMLGKLGDPRAVNPLIRALVAPGYQTPLYAAQALGQIGDVRAIEPLLMLAATGRDKTRQAAIDALQRLGYDPTKTPDPEPMIES
jgi:HEAT repeat protein